MGLDFRSQCQTYEAKKGEIPETERGRKGEIFGSGFGLKRRRTGGCEATEKEKGGRGTEWKLTQETNVQISPFLTLPLFCSPVSVSKHRQWRTGFSAVEN